MNENVYSWIVHATYPGYTLFAKDASQSVTRVQFVKYEHLATFGTHVSKKYATVPTESSKGAHQRNNTRYNVHVHTVHTVR